MNLRLCALFASTLLTGCVFTDSSNETGGDFLQSHGVSVLPSDTRGFALRTLSVETIPMEGVRGSHGTEDAALGALGGDSLRLVFGFNLADTTAMSDSLRKRNDLLTRLRWLKADTSVAMPAMNVRARFVVIRDSLLLPGLLAGIEPSVLKADGFSLDGLVDTSYAIPALGGAETVSLHLPGSIAAQAQEGIAKRKTDSSWLVVILDSRTGTDQRVRLNPYAWLDHKSVSTSDTAQTIGLGKFGGNRTWQTTGFQASGSRPSVGWWPSGGRRLRVRLDAASLRSEMRAGFGIAADSAGGLDNTFNVLQARISAPFDKVSAETSPASVTISSVAIRDSFANNFTAVSVPSKDSGSKYIELKPEQKRICGLNADPKLTFRSLPGGFQMELRIENDLQELPTQYSLARGSSSIAQDRSFLPVGDSIEFRLYGLVRVRVKAASAKSVEIRRWFLEQASLEESQEKTYHVNRTEAMLANGGRTKLAQEVRSSLTQLLNRASSQVEFDLGPVAVSDPSSRIVAIPTDPSKVFDSVKVVVRPLLSRNN